MLKGFKRPSHRYLGTTHRTTFVRRVPPHRKYVTEVAAWTFITEIPSFLVTPVLQSATALAGSLAVFAARRTILNTLYDCIAQGRAHPTGPAITNENFAPLSSDAEIYEHSLAVSGSLPAQLEGAYIRGGPNSYFAPTQGSHWFDGDGLLHATRIHKGRASYNCHFVRTSKLKQEIEAGQPLFVKFVDMVGRRGLALALVDGLRRLLGTLDYSQGCGTANTGIVHHAGRLLSLYESDMPYQVHVTDTGVVGTLGRLQLPEKDGIKVHEFTAHPKTDPATGEMYFFSYNFHVRPFLKAGTFDAQGTLSRQWSLDIPWPTMMHDMAITEHHVVLFHLPMCFDPEVMAKEDDFPITFKPDLPARIGLLPREALGGPADEKTRWFELPAFMVFHVANAWEDAAGNIQIWACHHDRMSLNFGASTHYAQPHKYTLDTTTGDAIITKMSDIYADFPVVHPGLVGRPTRWAWVAIINPASSLPDFIGIGKLDLSTSTSDAVFDTSTGKHVSQTDALVAQINFPAGCYGGEPTFVPRNPGAPTSDDEDDGFLLIYVARGLDQPSALHVYDAKTMASEPISVVTLPQRVPMGFHGLWISEEQMRTQHTQL